MKIYLTLLLLICSCSQINLTESQNKMTFDKMMKQNFFDTDVALRKMEGVKIKEVKVIRVREISDMLSTMVALSTEMHDRKATHYSYFSSDYKFIVDELSIKNLAKEKGCDVVMYVDLHNISGIKLSRNLSRHYEQREEGQHFFNAVFYCKVDPRITIEIEKAAE